MTSGGARHIVVLSLNYYEKIFDLLPRVFSSLLFTWLLGDKN